MALTRFIAGVICPHCGLIDKTVLHKNTGHEYTECVRCGHQQHQPPPPTKPARAEQIITFTRTTPPSE